MAKRKENNPALTETLRLTRATALCKIAHRDRAVTVERYCPPLWTGES